MVHIANNFNYFLEYSKGEAGRINYLELYNETKK